MAQIFRQFRYKKAVIIAVLLLILAILGIFGYRWSQKRLLTEPKRTESPSGQVPSGFPDGLVFNPIEISKGYKLDYGQANQLTVEYTSKDPYQLAMTKANVYLTKNKYYISNKNITEQSAVVYGVSDKYDINFVSMPGPDKTSKVIVTYLIKSN